MVVILDGLGGTVSPASTQNDVQALAAQIAGTKYIWDDRYNVTAPAGVGTAWADALGLGATLTGAFSQDAVTKILAFNGSTDSLIGTAMFDASVPHSIIYIGTVEAGAFVAAGFYESAHDTYNTFGNSGSNVAVVTILRSAQATAVSTTPRLMLLSRTAAGTYGVSPNYPVDQETAGWVQGRVGSSGRTLYLHGTGASGAAKMQIAGLRDFSLSYPAHVQAVLVTDHPVTSTEWAAIKNWATAQHTWTSDDAVAKCVLFDGNSLTDGNGTATAGHEYPTEVMAQAAFSGVDWVNLGVNSRSGVDQLSSMPWRVNPFFSGNHAKKIYVCWELTNDIAARSFTGAQAAAHVLAMCASAKAAGATACIAVSCIKRGTGAAFETERTAANAVLLGAIGTSGLDAVADVGSIPQLSDTTNATYYNADGVHLTDAGYLLVATDATYGVATIAAPYL